MSPESINQPLAPSSSTIQSLSESEAAPPLQKVDNEEAEIDNRPPDRGPKRFLWPGLLLLLVLGGIGWIVFNRVVMPILIFSRLKPQPQPVQLTNPQATTVEDSSEYVAALQSRQSVMLQPRVSGQVLEIYVKAGDRVEAGTPLLQIDSAEQQAQVSSQLSSVDSSAAEVESARADAASARDNLVSLQARRDSRLSDVKWAQQEYDRYKDLLREGATSQQILDDRLRNLQTAKAALDQVEADMRAQQGTINRAEANIDRNQRSLEQAEAEVVQEQVQLDYYTISAPFSGIVGDIPVKVGDYVSTTSQLLSVTQNQELEIQIAVPVERAPDLRRGMQVQLVDQVGKVLQTGLISFIAPNVDPQSQSVLAKAVFRNSKNALRADQFVRVRVIWAKRPGVLVPTSSISRLAGQNFIFVARSYKDTDCAKTAQAGPPNAPKIAPDQLVAFQQPIKLGRIINNNQEVLEGLQGNDRIITTGILQLQNCTAIAESPQ